MFNVSNRPVSSGTPTDLCVLTDYSGEIMSVSLRACVCEWGVCMYKRCQMIKMFNQISHRVAMD